MIGLIDQICLASDVNHGEGELIVPFRELESVTERHFEHEEALLEELYVGMPRDRRLLREMLAVANIEQRAEHRKRLGELADITRRALHATDGDAAANPCEELTAWFIDHAITYEAPMKTIIQSA